MKKAFQFLFGVSLFVTIWTQAPLSAKAQQETRLRRVTKETTPPPAVRPQLDKNDFDLLFAASDQSNYSTAQKTIPGVKTVLLKDAIVRRLGTPYRFHGEDDRGYDCSGFVWSVFRDAGADFER